MNAPVPLVTVIVPTRDRPALLREALASVRRVEGADLRLDVVVVDTGSPDSGAADVAGAAGGRYLRAAGRGASAARNAGLRAAGGEFIAFLDDDDVWLPGHLRPHLEVLRARPEVGAVLGRTVSCDYDLNPLTRPWPDPAPPGRTPFARLFAFFPQIGSTVVRAAVARSVGDFDEELISEEDWDWQLRVALGHAVAFVDAACVAYRTHPDGTPDRDDLQWSRLAHFDRAFWRSVRRAGPQRPQWPVIARQFLRCRGQFATHFLSSASVQAASGNRRLARRALFRAFVASPVHGVFNCVRQAAVRRALAAAVTPAALTRPG